ncbi:hypothetical protein V8C44DRAFT_324241 [Trichoderma aethiopicum]
MLSLRGDYCTTALAGFSCKHMPLVTFRRTKRGSSSLCGQSCGLVTYRGSVSSQDGYAQYGLQAYTAQTAALSGVDIHKRLVGLEKSGPPVSSSC